MFTTKSNPKGFSLVELMVAITIGLIILAVISTVFVSSKKTYRVQEALSRLQENGRYAIDFMGRDMRMAGYMGCICGGTTINTIANSVAGLTLLNTTTNPPSLDGIIGYEQASVPTSGFPVLRAEVKANTDVVEIQHFSTNSAKVITPGSVLNAAIHIQGNPLNFQTDEVLVVTNCVNADFFQATTVSAGSGDVAITHANSNNTANFTFGLYGPDNGSELLRLESSVYYIGTGTAGYACPASSLCRKHLGFYLATDGNRFCTNATTGTIQGYCVEQVAEGVEDLQILYGVNTTNNNHNTADKFVDAASITTNNCTTNTACWPNVVSARINLLLRTVDPTVSPENITTYPSSQITLFNGSPPTITAGSTTAPARALRRVYTETITLRNRAL